VRATAAAANATTVGVRLWLPNEEAVYWLRHDLTHVLGYTVKEKDISRDAVRVSW